MTKTPRKPVQIAIDSVAQLAALYAAWKLIPFGIDKLTGTGHSIEGFRQIGAGLGVDPTAFRYFVGAQEVLVSLGLVAALFAFVPFAPPLEKLGRLGIRLGAPGLVATMIGALATEWIVRPGQQQWLVDLALRLMAIGIPLTVWTVVRFGVPFATQLKARLGARLLRAQAA